MDGVILNSIVVNKRIVTYNFSVKGVALAKYFNDTKLFIEYPQEMTGVPTSILAIPFVATVIPLMWATNTVLWVSEIDETFYNALKNIKNAYRELYNHFALKGNFVSANLIDNSYLPTKDALLLFSGGIDAYTTYVRIYDKKPGLVNIQGWYKNLSEQHKDADQEFEMTQTVATKERVNGYTVRSNFATLINEKHFCNTIKPKLHDTWWHGFNHSMGFISIAIPLAYLHGYKTVYIASSVPMGEYVMCASHVTIDSEFKFANAGCCNHNGSELTRQEKVNTIVNFVNDTGNQLELKVCSFNDHNCCRCTKCFRSILGIVAAGGDPRKFGFMINGSLKEHFSKVMEEDIKSFGISNDSALHWPAIIRQMKQNYNIIAEKDFVDWFINYDFVGKQK